MNLRVHSGLLPSLSISTRAKGGHQDHATPGHVILDLKGGYQVLGSWVNGIYFHVFLLYVAFIYYKENFSCPYIQVTKNSS
jgi:hypothetical protein